jgi:tetratricopeptide (TPR) repeat protein
MGSTSANRDTKAIWGTCLLLVIFTAVVYGRTVDFGFVAFDDEIYVYENPHVTSGLSLRGLKWVFTQVHESNWHPLTTLSHMLDCSLYGLWAGGHHLTNVLLHAAGSIFLFLALRRMTGAVWRSGMVAALFCLHPLHVESVAWISERKDVLSGVFFGLTLWAYAAYVEGAAGFWLVVTAYALGLLSKPTLVTLPFVLLLLDYWPLRRWTDRTPNTSLILEKLPLLAMSTAICITTYLVQRSRGAINEQAPLLLKLQTALLAYGNYLVKTILPVNLAASYPLRPAPAPLACAICLAAMVSISAATILLARHGRGYAAVGWFWFLGMIAPVSGIVLIGDQSMADRYTYLSLIGLFIAVVFGACDLLKGRLAGFGFAASAAVLAVFSVLSFVQVGYWRDSETLWRHVLSVAPENPLAHSNLAVVVHDRGPEGKAEAEFHIAEALRIRPDDALANNNFGFQLARKGDWEGAIRHYRIAIESRPSFAPAHRNLGESLRFLHRTSEAEAALREALRLRPEYPAAENSLGDALALEGRWPDAVAHCRRAVELDPNVARYQVDLGASLVQLGAAKGSRELVSEGIEHCKTGIAMNPDDADAHHELASAYNAAGMTKEAVGEWRETLKLRPGHPTALKQIGTLLVNARHSKEALTILAAAEAAVPGDVEVRRMKALAHALARQFPATIAEFREILKLDPNDSSAMTSLAWFEATSPDNSVRNGVEAVELARRAAALQHPPTPHALDVLAAAYAETGRFKDAVETAHQAKQAAAANKDQKPLEGIDERIKLYQAGKPFRDMAIAPEVRQQKEPLR